MHLSFRNTYVRKAHSSRAFTVVELMVTVTIVVLVTGLIMIQYSAFNNSVLLKSQAYLTAFDIREAQSMAVSIRGQGNEFREEYGLYFKMNSADEYLLFQDNDTNGTYSPARYDTGEEVGLPYRVDPRFSIVNLCIKQGSVRTCYAEDPDTPTAESLDPDLASLTISFSRPNFDALFFVPNESGISSAEIIFSPHNNAVRRKVSVFQTGQISVD